jgi:hypothetical protein
MTTDRDLDDFDDTGLSPQLRAQIERFERNQELHERGRRSARQKLRIRRKLEDLNAARRMRDEIDYLH